MDHKYIRQSANRHPSLDKRQDYLPIRERSEVMSSHSEKRLQTVETQLLLGERSSDTDVAPRLARIEMNAGRGSRRLT